MSVSLAQQSTATPQLIILFMQNEISLALSSLGIGGLLGVYAKSVLGKGQLKFSKVFD